MENLQRNITCHKGMVTREDRRLQNGHGSALIWLTGLPASGKSTISCALEQRLFQERVKTVVLDGDNIRHGLSRDLGFSAADRRENLRRAGEVARIFVDSGFIAIAAFASPYKQDRTMVRGLFEKGEFIEIYLKCALDVCEARDPKGLYRKARSGEIINFTGISGPYEPPENPEMVIETDRIEIAEGIEMIAGYLREKGLVG